MQFLHQQAKWVEDAVLDGEPAHHLHVVLDREKMRYLVATAKARYEYLWLRLLDTEPQHHGSYGDPTSVDVQADVWLAAEDLAVRQIDMLIQIATQGGSGGEETTWTITRNVRFDAGEPSAIAEPVKSISGVLSSCRRDAAKCSESRQGSMCSLLLVLTCIQAHYATRGVSLRRSMTAVVAPATTVSVQPTNAKRPRREDGKGIEQFSLMLMDYRGDDLCLPCWR